MELKSLIWNSFRGDSLDAIKFWVQPKTIFLFKMWKDYMTLVKLKIIYLDVIKLSTINTNSSKAILFLLIIFPEWVLLFSGAHLILMSLPATGAM